MIEKLNSLSIDYDFKLVSFGINSLFTNVPVYDLLDYLKGSLENITLPVSQHVFIELLKLCIKDCKFEFNGNFFIQKNLVWLRAIHCPQC